MRGIKFRGYRSDTGELIVGYYGYKELTDEHFIIVPTFDSHSDKRPQYFTDYLVEPTVAEYTGLKDKNGKEIYEHDIIRMNYSYGPPSDAQVIFEKGCFGFLWIRPKHPDDAEFKIFDDLWLPNEFEVFGNIWDNPELLK